MTTIFFDNQYLKVVCPLIKTAQTEILVCVYEWAWYDHQLSGTAQDVNRAVCTRSVAGVSVRAILHHDNQKSHLSRLNRRSAGRLRRSRAQVRFGSTKQIIHAKFWVFDGTTAVICTHNISTRALTTNREIGVIITDPEQVAQITAYFEAIWRRSRDEGE